MRAEEAEPAPAAEGLGAVVVPQPDSMRTMQNPDSGMSVVFITELKTSFTMIVGDQDLAVTSWGISIHAWDRPLPRFPSQDQSLIRSHIQFDSTFSRLRSSHRF